MNAKFGKQLVNLLPLLLFAVLAASILTVLLTGAKLYGGISTRDHDAHVGRTAAQYITTKVRQSPSNSIETADFGGVDALVLRENLEGFDFVTRIYCYDGYLRELFTFEGEEMLPSDGEMLVPLEEATFAIEESLLKVTLTDEQGALRELTLNIEWRESDK